MKIKYKNTIDDLMAFMKYHYSNSGAFRKQKMRNTYFIPIILFTLMVALYLVNLELWILIFGSIFIITYTAIMHQTYKTGVYGKARKFYEEQNVEGFVCEHELEITEEWIKEKTHLKERKDKWLAVHKIALDIEYAFLYVGPQQAHIIPRKSIIEGEVEPFIESAMSFWEKSKSHKTI